MIRLVIVGRCYVQHAVMWHWNLPLCVCLTFVSVHPTYPPPPLPPPSPQPFPPRPPLFTLVLIRRNCRRYQHVLALYAIFWFVCLLLFFNNNSVWTNSSKICVWCLCFFVYITLGSFCWFALKDEMLKKLRDLEPGNYCHPADYTGG